MSTTPILQATGIVKQYGKFTALGVVRADVGDHLGTLCLYPDIKGKYRHIGIVCLLDRSADGLGIGRVDGNGHHLLYQEILDLLLLLGTVRAVSYYRPLP